MKKNGLRGGEKMLIIVTHTEYLPNLPGTGVGL